jgi:dipeptidyl aminopeptidase/acylaminoacyl peptidase
MQTKRGGRYWFNLLAVAGLFLLTLSMAATLGLSYRQTQLYLHPPRSVASPIFLQERGIQFQTVTLITEDGLRLHAWYTPPQNGVVILVAHGHAASIPVDMYALFAEHGYGVLAWDFRAHGESEGEFTSLGYYEVRDVKAALDYALAQPGVKHVAGWGGSMGAVTMIRAAAQYPQIEAVVADSAFSTLEDELNLRVPYPGFRELVRFWAEVQTGIRVQSVRPVDDIGKISPRSVYIIQGMSDAMVPLQSAQQLFNAAGEPRYLWTEEKAYHLNMFAKYPKEYEERVIGFFTETVVTK